MILNLWTFLFEIINFAVLVFILRRLLYGPLRAAIDQRRADNERVIVEAQAARDQAAKLQGELEAQKAELERDRQVIIRSARASGESDRKAILEEAEQTARRRREDLEKTLVAHRADVLQGLKAELIQSSIALAERLLQESADASLDGKLSDALIATLDRLPEEERARLRRDWQPGQEALVEAARPLEGTVLKRFETTVASLVGEPVTVQFQTRPELLGGARLSLGGHVWDSSLFGQIDEIRPAVTILNHGNRR